MQSLKQRGQWKHQARVILGVHSLSDTECNTMTITDVIKGWKDTVKNLTKSYWFAIFETGVSIRIYTFEVKVLNLLSVVNC